MSVVYINLKYYQIYFCFFFKHLAFIGQQIKGQLDKDTMVFALYSPLADVPASCTTVALITTPIMYETPN
jgi:hypothetical protein